MFSSVLRRSAFAVIGVLAATTLVSGTATGAGPHTTSIAIRVAHQAVKPGGSDVISGNIRVGSGQALSGKTLTLEARLPSDTAFVPVATALSGPRGGVAVTVTPAETTRYRWVFAGDAADRASHSGIATIKVRQPAHPATRLATSLSIRVAHPVVTATGDDTITGRLVSHRKALRNQIVVLLARADKATTWGFVAAKRTGSAGGVAFGIRPVSSSHYKLVFQGTPNFRPARSAVVHVAVRTTALSIALAADHVAPGGPGTVTGVLTKSGLPFAGQAVQLWGKPAGSKQKFAALASTVSGADGSVSFTVTPARTMRYFLLFPRTTDSPAAQSPTRTMVVS